MLITSLLRARVFFAVLGGLPRPNAITLDPPCRFAGVKKKFNLEDNPKKVKPAVLVKTLRGFQFNDGDFVYKGDILVRQASCYLIIFFCLLPSFSCPLLSVVSFKA